MNAKSRFEMGAESWGELEKEGHDEVDDDDDDGSITNIMVCHC